MSVSNVLGSVVTLRSCSGAGFPCNQPRRKRAASLKSRAGTNFRRKSQTQVPKEYIPGVTKGLEEMMTSGALAGFPVVDVVATLYDGSYHDVDSSVLAFQIAARAAFRCGPTLESAGKEAVQAAVVSQQTQP